MSASREKKIRQDSSASGYVDPKTAREREAQKAQRRTSIAYICTAVAFVIVAAIVLIWNSNVIQKSVTAYTVDGEAFTAADVDYYTHTVYNNYKSSYGNYVSYFLTAESLQEEALKQLKNTVTLANAAKAEGYTITDEMRASIDETLASIDSYATSSGYSRKQYLKAVFGSLMSEKVFIKHLEYAQLAAAYSDDFTATLSYTDDQLTAEYNANPAKYDSVDVEYVLFKTDINEAEADETVIKEAMDAAKANADAVVSRYTAGEGMEALATELGGTYTHSASTSYATSDMLTWAFDNARQVGDTTVAAFSESGGYYAVVFHGRTQNTYHSVNVRHILIKVEDDDISTAEEKAKSLLDDFNTNGATEEYFAELANANSSDSAVGGLYESVRKGQMVSEFEDWCFDPARQSGDTGIIFDSAYNGYHVMYFVGTNDQPYWMEQANNALTNAAYEEWFNGIVDKSTAAEDSGLKYVENLL